MNRRDKDDLMHGFRHELRGRLPLGLDASGHIDVAQDNAAKNRSLGIGVFRQHRDSNCGESFCHGFSRHQENPAEGHRLRTIRISIPLSAGMGYIAVRGRSLWIGRDRR